MARSRFWRTARVAGCALVVVGGFSASSDAFGGQDPIELAAVGTDSAVVQGTEAVTSQAAHDRISGDQLLKMITRQAPFVQVNYVAQLQGALSTPGLLEASGLAQSRRDPAVVWTHNDSGFGPYLFAFDQSAEGLGRVVLNNVRPYDWEDMAAFMWNDEPWLLIADTGDNASKRSSSTLYLLREPDLGDRNRGQLIKRDVDVVLKFRYPDGPADTESVAVDEQAQKIYLLTKRQRPPRLYSIALPRYPHSTLQSEKMPSADVPDGVVVAKFESTLYPLPRPTVQDLIDHPKFGWHKSQPTAMDFSSDGSFAVVQTYGFGYRFNRSAQQSWAEALAGQPVQFKLPALQQGEALAIASDSESLLCTSEGKNAPLYRLRPELDAHTLNEGNQP